MSERAAGIEPAVLDIKATYDGDAATQVVEQLAGEGGVSCTRGRVQHGQPGEWLAVDLCEVTTHGYAAIGESRERLHLVVQGRPERGDPLAGGHAECSEVWLRLTAATCRGLLHRQEVATDIDDPV